MWFCVVKYTNWKFAIAKIGNMYTLQSKEPTLLEPPMNGRRAWRQWLKSQRKHDKDSWAANIGACLGRAAYARRHRGTDAGQGLPDAVPTVPATPFTAHSLVGMTMGVRKRKAWTAYQSGLSESWSFWCAKYGIGGRRASDGATLPKE